MKSRENKAKRILYIFLICLICLSSMSLVNAESDIVSEEEAYKVVVNFVFSNKEETIKTDIDGDLYANGISEITEGYPSKIIFNKPEPFYDKDDVITAYMIRIHNSNNEPNGYVIVSASKSAYPIIEYSYESVPFTDMAIEKIIDKEYKNKKVNKEEIKLLYNGKLNYSVKVKDENYYLNDGSYVKVDKKTLKKSNNKEIYKDEIKHIKNEWKQLTKEPLGGSNPPTGQIITSPISYESNYQARGTDYCYNMGSRYYTCSELSSAGNNCTPTAGTNMCVYWTRRVSSYSILKIPNQSNSWCSTHSRIYTLMGTNVTHGDGTHFPNPALSGLKSYFRERGLTNTAGWYATCSSTTHFNNYIKSEINVGHPVLLGLWSDKVYKNHSVLALGYERYKYNGVYSSHYVRIADGWATHPNRYIHYETGRSSMMRLKIKPAW